MISKPMLAETCEDLASLKFPVLATPKLDGIRCLVLNGKALSRKFKEIPNRHIQALVSKLPEGLDGELMLNDIQEEESGGENRWTRPATFQEITSAVMSEDGEPDFVYNVFDRVTSSGLEIPYMIRMTLLEDTKLPSFVQKILPEVIRNYGELLAYETACLETGYEGVMVRDPNGPYKCGRSTVKEGFLLKIKRFKDSEAVVIGFEERMHNENEAKVDELGHTKRSSHKANMVLAGTLGALKVLDQKTGLTFQIGTGFDDALRKEIWNNTSKYLNKIVKYKSQEIGTKDKPRFPVFLGFRDLRDM